MSVKKEKLISPDTSLPGDLDVGSLLKGQTNYCKREYRKKVLHNIYRIITHLNRSSLGCFIKRLPRNNPTHYDYFERRYSSNCTAFNGTNLEGTSKDGRSIYIQLLEVKRKPHPKRRKLMQEMHARGAIVGCAIDYNDCFDIISENGKRKKLTFNFLEKSDGKTKIDSDTNGSKDDQPGTGVKTRPARRSPGDECGGTE